MRIKLAASITNNVTGHPIAILLLHLAILAYLALIYYIIYYPA